MPNINKMNPTRGLKGIVTDVSQVFNRARQMAEETMGVASKTVFDKDFEKLIEQAEQFKHITDKMVTNLEAVVQPNPNMRYGDKLLEKIQTDFRADRMRNLEYLGNDMIEAGVSLGPQTVYGSYLIKIGRYQEVLGQTEKEFVQKAYNTIIIPLRRFLDEDIKTITKERRVLETKRLDLDAAKNRLKKAKNTNKPIEKNKTPEMIEKEIEELENDVKVCQEEFDKQYAICKLLLQGLSQAQSNHVRCLLDFFQSQNDYYVQCYNIMNNLQKELQQQKNQPNVPIDTTNILAKTTPKASKASSDDDESGKNGTLQDKDKDKDKDEKTGGPSPQSTNKKNQQP